MCDAHVAGDDAPALEAVLATLLPRQDASTVARREWLLLSRAELAVRRGDHAGAAAVLDEVAAVLRALPIPFVGVSLESLVARVAVAHDDLEAASAASTAAAASAAAIGTPWWTVVVELTAAQVAAAAGDPDAAENAAQHALALCAAHSFAGPGADALELLAVLAQAAESRTEAARLLGAADALRSSTGLRRAPVHERPHAELLARLTEHLGAEARAAAGAEGQSLDLARAAAYAARARGERRRPSHGWAALTPTELEVVELLSAGATNAEIAARLFITVSTVKTHVHHALTKLGATNRTQLAAAALRRGPAVEPRTQPGPSG